jgi:hypothetical protein
MTDPTKQFGETDAAATPPTDTMPLLISTDLGSVQVLIRERDDNGLGLPPTIAPFVVQVEGFGDHDRRLATIPPCPGEWCREPLTGLPERPSRVWRRQAS